MGPFRHDGLQMELVGRDCLIGQHHSKAMGAAVAGDEHTEMERRCGSSCGCFRLGIGFEESQIAHGSRRDHLQPKNLESETRLYQQNRTGSGRKLTVVPATGISFVFHFGVLWIKDRDWVSGHDSRFFANVWSVDVVHDG